MTIQLFDLACRDERIFFSPYCWRTRMALKHKGLDFESLPWHFTDKDKIERTGEGRVPVIIDGETWVNDSSEIAIYLDQAYPDRPPLMKDAAARATARFIDAWCTTVVFPALRPICVYDVYKIIIDRDRDYFRSSREKMLGSRLEELSTDPEAERKALNRALRPMDEMLAHYPYLGGDEPTYADYIVFGTLMWADTVCAHNPIDPETRVAAWYGRLLDMHDGYARSAPRARD
jgi:glutathione S-transferase